jgi:hypothetical protein
MYRCERLVLKEVDVCCCMPVPRAFRGTTRCLAVYCMYVDGVHVCAWFLCWFVYFTEVEVLHGHCTLVH